ncbi:MAG: hypothetical protein RLZZ94_1892, partial [Bacteroidota bacterium]
PSTVFDCISIGPKISSGLKLFFPVCRYKYAMEGTANKPNKIQNFFTLI